MPGLKFGAPEGYGREVVADEPELVERSDAVTIMTLRATRRSSAIPWPGSVQWWMVHSAIAASN